MTVITPVNALAWARAGAGLLFRQVSEAAPPLDCCAALLQNCLMEPFHGFVSVQGRGTVALPSALRRRYHLDEPGAQVEITERADGVLELRPTVPVPAAQAWFWTEDWQRREREVDAHIAAGEIATFATVDDFAAHLDKLVAESPADEANPRTHQQGRRRGGR